MGKLTTHVLDTAHGRPAAGVAIALFRVSGVRREAVGHAATNADGRCAAPLLEGAALTGEGGGDAKDGSHVGQAIRVRLRCLGQHATVGEKVLGTEMAR